MTDPHPTAPPAPSAPTARLRQLADGPKSADPQRQLDYLAEVIEVVNEIGHPRVKPLKKKLNRAFVKLGEGAQAGRSPEEIAKELAADLQSLRQQTYELLTVVVTQLRTTLKAKRDSLSPPEREYVRQLHKGLGLFAKAMRKMVIANKRDDDGGRDQAIDAMNAAHTAMAESEQPDR